jgi:hypothetical protein
MNAVLPPDSDFEARLRLRLHQLAEHAPSTVRAPEELVVSSTGRPRRWQRRRVAGIGATVAVLAGAFGLTTMSFQGADGGGAATPEDAVRALVDALSSEDVLGALDVLEPTEGQALRGAIESIASESQRIGLLSDSLDLNRLGGLDLAFDEVTFSTEYIETGLAAVTLADGTFAATFEPVTFPLGGALRGALDASAGRIGTDLATTEPSVFAAVVERDGRWYVSPSFTAAEYARRAAGLPMPELPASVDAVGSPSPQAAATAFYDAVAALDAVAVLATMESAEAAAIIRYSPLWLADLEGAVGRLVDDGLTLSVSLGAVDEQGSGSRRTMTPTTFVIEGTAPASATGGTWLADPTLPTLVHSWNGGEVAVVEPGEAIPETIADLTLVDVAELDDAFWSRPFNSTWADPSGRIEPLRFLDPDRDGGPQPLRVERSGGCTTYTGDVFGEFFFRPSDRVDGGYRRCDDEGGSTGIASGLFLLVGLGTLTELPAVGVVEVDGAWFVSPIATLIGSFANELARVPAGANLLDTPASLFLFDGMTRQLLEMNLNGRPPDEIAEACRPIAVVAGGVVTGIVADPPAADVRACGNTLWSVGVSDEWPAVTAVEQSP